MKTRNRQRQALLWGSLCALSALACVATAEVFRWTDEHGHIHFGDKPPAGAATEQVEIRVNTYTSPRIVSRPSHNNPKASGRKSVVMYSATWCGVCKRAAAYFKAKGIPYKDYDVENSAKGRTDFRRLGGRGVPIIMVGSARMNGFSAAHFEQLYFR
jgi:glutaredoxin